MSNIKRQHLERNTCFNKTFFQVPDPDAVAGPLEVQLCDRMVDRLGAELEKENGKTKILLNLEILKSALSKSSSLESKVFILQL